MIDRIVLNKLKTEALIVFTDKSPVLISHDKGLVMDLVLYILTPKLDPNITYTNYINSLEDTNPCIDISTLREVA